MSAVPQRLVEKIQWQHDKDSGARMLPESDATEQVRATRAEGCWGSLGWIHDAAQSKRARLSQESLPFNTAGPDPTLQNAHPAWRSTRTGWARDRGCSSCKHSTAQPKQALSASFGILQTSHISMLASSVSQMSAPATARLASSTQKAPTMASISIAQFTSSNSTATGFELHSALKNSVGRQS